MSYSMEVEGIARLKKRFPWVAVDPDIHREWVFPEPMRYFVVKDPSGMWFICDDIYDMPVEHTSAKTRKGAIRQFYKYLGRPLPRGEKIRHFTGLKIRDQS